MLAAIDARVVLRQQLLMHGERVVERDVALAQQKEPAQKVNPEKR
jgi:hypothetical protein